MRRYRAEDEAAAIALWLVTWQRAYPDIDFTARVDWWRQRWRHELVPNAAIMVAEQASALVGFVTVDASGYLDQLVVAPQHWGSALADRLLTSAAVRACTCVVVRAPSCAVEKFPSAVVVRRDI